MSSIKSYSEKYTKVIQLKNAKEAFLRPIKDTDEQLLYDLLYSCSYDTIYYRFMSSAIYMNLRKGKTQSVMNIIKKFCNIDYDNHLAIVALIRENNEERIVSEGRYVKIEGKSAEIAIITADDWQRQGLATKIGEFLIEIAKAKGIKFFEGEILLSNYKLLSLLKNIKINYTKNVQHGSLHFKIDLDKPFLE